jgi:hypothetical protein
MYRCNRLQIPGALRPIRKVPAQVTQNANPLKPTASLLCKLGSIVVHVEEMSSAKGHPVDKYAFGTVMNDPEVQDWLAQMRAMAMIPEKR